MTQFFKAANDNNTGIFAKLANWITFARTCNALEALDDSTLRDLGIARSQIPTAVRTMMNDNQNNSVAS